MSQVDFERWQWARLVEGARHVTTIGWISILTPLIAFVLGASYMALLIVAPIPRPAKKSEKRYVSILHDGTRSSKLPLTCWYDDFFTRRKLARKEGRSTADTHTVEDAEVFMTLVVPAYNEEERLTEMLEEAVQFLKRAYGPPSKGVTSNGTAPNGKASESTAKGWEILVVSDGSTDKTADVALDFAKEHGLKESAADDAALKTRARTSDVSSSGTLRVITLEENRGKGGAVTHGMRHARGQYIVFADADGASRFSDLAGLVDGCNRVKDKKGRAVGIGSRAHLVGSEIVVKRSFLRNALMHSFHLLLRLMTPPATAAIRDTQCGFKLFTRPSLPYIIPYMHSEGWIFDVEMLMLAEAAEIPMVEVSIGWKEVKGSKLNVIWDSLGMAWGLAVLRAAWITGVYQRDF